MGDGPLLITEKRNSPIQHGVYGLSIGRRPNRPRGSHAVKAVDDGRQIYLARGNMEFSNICKPLLVWLLRMEIPGDDILRGGTDLVHVGIVFPPFHTNGVEGMAAISFMDGVSMFANSAAAKARSQREPCYTVPIFR